MNRFIPAAISAAIAFALSATAFMYAEDQHTKAIEQIRADLNEAREATKTDPQTVKEHRENLKYYVTYLNDVESRRRANEHTVDNLSAHQRSTQHDLSLLQKDLIEIKRLLKKWDDAQGKAAVRDDE